MFSYLEYDTYIDEKDILIVVDYHQYIKYNKIPEQGVKALTKKPRTIIFTKNIIYLTRYTNRTIKNRLFELNKKEKYEYKKN